MKKFLIAIVSLVMSVMLGVSGLFGCQLITIDNEKDMAQVVATVNIGKEDVIYKKDVSVAYMNYGYVYEQYYGYTKAQTIDLIVNSLVTNRVMLQNAINEFDKGDAPYDTVYKNPQISDKWDLERYLEDAEVVNAYYNTYKDINSLLDAYDKDANPTIKNDTAPTASRTVPTNAANDEEITTPDKQAYIDKGFDISGKRHNAFDELIELFDNNGLKGAEYDGRTLESTDYFDKVLTSYLENEIIEKFQEILETEARKTVTYEDLVAAYDKDKQAQTEWSASEFAAAMSSANASSPLLYGAYGNYGYVYNLLLGVDNIQSALINELNADTKLTQAERRVERAKVLAMTTATDLRAPWIVSGYDMEATGNTVKFTGDYTFNKDYSLPFQGTVKELSAKTDDKDATYGVTSTTKYTLNGFIDMMEEYVYGTTASNGAFIDSTFDYAESVYKSAKYSATVDAYADKINELIFAFSTDEGSLNTYMGYAIAPEVDGTDSETYVTEFAAAARELIKAGGNSYVIVATDYGYHVMFYSQVFSGNYDAGTFEKYLDSLDYDKGLKTWKQVYEEDMIPNWNDFEDTNFYMYALASTLSSSVVTKKVSEVETTVLNKYVYGAGETYVKINQDAYADLIG